MHEKAEDVKCKCSVGACPCCEACECKCDHENQPLGLDKDTAAMVEEFSHRELGS